MVGTLIENVMIIFTSVWKAYRTYNKPSYVQGHYHHWLYMIYSFRNVNTSFEEIEA